MSRHLKTLVFVLASVAAAAVAGYTAPAGDDTLENTLHDLRLVGSHNSYKRALPPRLLQWVEMQDPARARQIDYSHYSIASQLDGGLRQLEVDVLADPEGGKYAEPFARRYLAEHGRRIGMEDGFDRDALAEPGMKVLHVPDIDIFTHCATFRACLTQIRDWSDRHPAHLPIFVLINVKETGAPVGGGVQPVVFGDAEYDRLDDEILAVWPRERLVTPADVVHRDMSLRESVVQHGWPSIEASRGKLIFIFDGNTQQTDVYRRDRPSLEGRVMFAAVAESLPEAAILVVNEPVGDHDRIKSLVEQGFIVRTRADAGFDESPEEMRERYEAAVSSGAQIISTDFYAGSPNAERAGYSVHP